MRRVSMTMRDELLGAVAARYRSSVRSEKTHILDEFAAVTGPHRKHAARLLRAGRFDRRSASRPRRRLYDEAVREALIVLWEASDRICGKRLKALIPTLVPAMERHGHLALATEIRTALGDERGHHRPRSAPATRADRGSHAPARVSLGDPTLDPGAHLLRLGRPAARLRRGRPRRPFRTHHVRRLRADARAHRRGHGLDRVRAAPCARA